MKDEYRKTAKVTRTAVKCHLLKGKPPLSPQLPPGYAWPTLTGDGKLLCTKCGQIHIETKELEITY